MPGASLQAVRGYVVKSWLHFWVLLEEEMVVVVALHERRNSKIAKLPKHKKGLLQPLHCNHAGAVSPAVTILIGPDSIPRSNLVLGRTTPTLLHPHTDVASPEASAESSLHHLSAGNGRQGQGKGGMAIQP